MSDAIGPGDLGDGLHEPVVVDSNEVEKHRRAVVDWGGAAWPRKDRFGGGPSFIELRPLGIVGFGADASTSVSLSMSAAGGLDFGAEAATQITTSFGAEAVIGFRGELEGIGWALTELEALASVGFSAISDLKVIEGTPTVVDVPAGPLERWRGDFVQGLSEGASIGSWPSMVSVNPLLSSSANWRYTADALSDHPGLSSTSGNVYAWASGPARLSDAITVAVVAMFSSDVTVTRFFKVEPYFGRSAFEFGGGMAVESLDNEPLGRLAHNVAAGRDDFYDRPHVFVGEMGARGMKLWLDSALVASSDEPVGVADMRAVDFWSGHARVAEILIWGRSLDRDEICQLGAYSFDRYGTTSLCEVRRPPAVSLPTEISGRRIADLVTWSTPR